MPGKRLEVNQQEELPRYAIVVTYGSPKSGSFVRHVGLLRDRTTASFGANVLVWHTAPPILAGDRTRRMIAANFDCIQVHAAAFLDDLSVSETKAMETALSNIDAQVRQLPKDCETSVRCALEHGLSDHYTASPAVEWDRDEKTGRRKQAKFSCAGFVAECYRRAGINLVDKAALFEKNPASLPLVSLGVVVQQYGKLAKSRDRRRQIGLSGDGPWRLLLPGYLMHAIDRQPEIVRKESFVPHIDDANYPR